MSKSITLNGRLKLSFPDGFHVMDASERGKLNFIEEGPGEVLSDPDRHIVISAGWRKSGLSAMLLSAAEVAKSMEAKTRKPMQAYGYRAEGFVSKNVGGERAEGFSYSYEAQGIRMYGESYAIKRGKVFYYLHFYAREALKADSIEVWNAILMPAEWR